MMADFGGKASSCIKSALPIRLCIAIGTLLSIFSAIAFLPVSNKFKAVSVPSTSATQDYCKQAKEFYFSASHDVRQGDYRVPEIIKTSTSPISPGFSWSLETGTPVYGDGQYVGSYARTNGSAGGNKITVHQEVYLKWDKPVNTGINFYNWPRFNAKSIVSAYTKIPNLPVNVTYNVAIQYTNSQPHWVGLSAGYHKADNFGRSTFTIQCRSTGTRVPGTDLYEVGLSCPFGYPNFEGAFTVVSDANKNGFLVDGKALAEGKATIDVEVTIEPVTACPIADFRGPLLNGKEVSRVSTDELAESSTGSNLLLVPQPKNATIVQMSYIYTDPSGKVFPEQEIGVGAATYINAARIGIYRIKMTASNQLGSDTLVKTLEVYEIPILDLQTVVDTDPNNPIIYYVVRGDMKNISVDFNGNVTDIGDRGTGVYSFPINNIVGYGIDKVHNLKIYGDHYGQKMMDEAFLDTKEKGYQTKREKLIFIFFVELSPKLTILLGGYLDVTFSVNVFNWEWKGLIGAKWDRLVFSLDKPLSTLCITPNIPRQAPVDAHVNAGFRVENASSGRGQAFFPAANVVCISAPKQLELVSSFGIWARAGQSSAVASIGGSSGGRWIFTQPPPGEVKLTIK